MTHERNAQNANRFARIGKRPLGLLSLVAILAGLLVTLAPGASAANPLPDPITDYANYPAGIVPSLIPAGCNAQGGAIITGAVYTANGVSTQFLESLTLHAGDTLTMKWTGWAQGCDSARISLAVKATDHPIFVPTDDQKLVVFDACGGDGPSCTNANGGFGPLTVTIPSRQVSCNFQIDAVIGAPLADVGPNGSFYSQDSRGANGKPSGPNMLIRANNGGEGDGQCVSPPTATAQFSCSLLNGTPGAIVTVTNPDSDDSAIVDIEKNGTVVVNDLTVAPSGTATGNVPFVNGETATVSVVNTFNGDEIYSHSFTANCLNPQATATKSCVAGGVQVHLSNLDATESATFSVSVDGTVTPHVVAGGASEDFTVPVADHATVHITITQGESTLVDDDFTMNCLNPTVTATKSCAQGGILVHLANLNATETATFFDTVDNETSAPIELAGGETRDFVIPVALGRTVHLAIRSGETTFVDENFTMDCVHPAATAVKSCTAGGVMVQLSNLGAELPVTFTVAAGTSTDHEISAGGAEMFTIPVAEGQTVHVTITSGGSTFVDDDFTMDCFNPAATATKSCTEGGVVVHLSNTDAELPTTFTVVAGDTSTPHQVAANGSEDFTIPVAEGQTMHVTITQGDTTLVDEDFTMDCFQPTATVENVCSSDGGGATFTFTNTGEQAGDLQVTKDGNVIETVTVPANGTASRTYAMTEDETATFRVTGAAYDSGDLSVTHDCAEVQAVTVTTAGPSSSSATSGTALARTGANGTKPLLTIAGLLLMFGGFVLALADRSTRRLAAARVDETRGQ